MPRGRASQNVASSQAAATSFSSSQAVPPSQSQILSQAQAQAEKLVSNMVPEELQRKVDELVQYLLVMDQKKQPIKKLDINKTVLKNFGKAHHALMKRAAEKLSKVFGIEVVELTDKLKGSYILINRLVKVDHLVDTWSEMDNAKTGLLMVVLSIVFMSGNVVQDGDLWHSLRSIGIDPDFPHETFGDVKKLITQEFTRQAYLEFTRLPNSEQPISEVRWGQRAEQETNKRNVLKFVSLMYNMEPEQWATQYQDVLNNEEQSGTEQPAS